MLCRGHLLSRAALAPLDHRAGAVAGDPVGLRARPTTRVSLQPQ